MQQLLQSSKMSGVTVKSGQDSSDKGSSFSPKPKTIEEYLPFLAYLENPSSGANCMKKRKGSAGDEPKNDVFPLQSNMLSLPKRYCYLNWSHEKVKEWCLIYHKAALLYAVNDERGDENVEKMETVPSLILPDVFKSILLVDIKTVYLDSNRKSFRLYIRKGADADLKDFKDLKETVFQFFTTTESNSQAWVDALNFAKKIQKEVRSKKSAVKAKDLVDLRKNFLARSIKLNVKRDSENEEKEIKLKGDVEGKSLADDDKNDAAKVVASNTLQSLIRKRVMPVMKFISGKKEADATITETVVGNDANENGKDNNDDGNTEEEGIQVIGDSNTAIDKKPQSIFTTIKNTLNSHMSPEKTDMSAASPISPTSPKADIGVQTDDIIASDFARAENKRLAKIMKGALKYEKSNDNFPDIRKTNLKILDRILNDEQDFIRGIKTQTNLAYIARNQAIKNESSNIYNKSDLRKWPKVYRPSDKTFKSAGGIDDADVTYDKIYTVDHDAPSISMLGSLKGEAFASHDVKDWVLRYNKKYSRKYWQNTKSGHTSWTDPSVYNDMLQEEKRIKSVHIDDIPVHKSSDSRKNFRSSLLINEGSKVDDVESDESLAESKIKTTINENINAENKSSKQKVKERLSIFDFDDSSVNFAQNIQKLSALMQMPTLLVAHNKQLILMSISKISLVLANNSNMKTIISIPLDEILSIDFDDNQTGLFRLLVKSNSSYPSLNESNSDSGYLLFESVDKEGSINFLHHVITAKLKL